MEADGADFVDIGAESTRPGALPVPPAEQLRRLRPVLRGLARRLSIPISVDTSSALVAEAALDDGAKLVNDVTALRGDRKMAALVARRKVPCILMHMKGRPRTMQKNPVYRDLLAEICDFLARAARAGEEAGIKPENILVDPGIGFGKTMEHNLEVLRRLGELKSLGRAIVVGPSRKRFLGMLLGTEPGERLEGTLAACVVASRNGANVVRVHDVKQVVRALKVADAVEAKG
jgi:dihydropteroate synthase